MPVYRGDSIASDVCLMHLAYVFEIIDFISNTFGHFVAAPVFPARWRLWSHFCAEPIDYYQGMFVYITAPTSERC